MAQTEASSSPNLVCTWVTCYNVDSDSIGLRICVSRRSPGVADTAGPGTTLTVAKGLTHSLSKYPILWSPPLSIQPSPVP